MMPKTPEFPAIRKPGPMFHPTSTWAPAYGLPGIRFCFFSPASKGTVRAFVRGSAVALCLFATNSLHADPQAYFSLHDDVQGQVLKAIDGSTTSLDAALFEMNSPVLASALQRAAERGVIVRLVISEKNPPSILKNVTDPRLHIRFLGGRSRRHRGLMHNKFAVFDHQQMVTGSFNWTSGAQYANYENALFEDDAKVVDHYAEQFETLWAIAAETPSRYARAHRRRKSHA